MILSREVAEQAASLAETPDEILPLFPPLERATIMVAKEIMKNEQKAAGADKAPAANITEHQTARGTLKWQI